MDAVSIFSGGVSFEDGKEVMVPSADMVPIRNELAEIFKELQIFTATYGLDEDVTLELGPRGLVMKLLDKALFQVGSASISPYAEPLLEKIGKTIAKGAVTVRIEGHTDDLPIHTSQYPSNWDLSAKRAVMVARYLTEGRGIDQQRVFVSAHSSNQAVRPNDTERNRALNRRVEIILVKQMPYAQANN